VVAFALRINYVDVPVHLLAYERKKETLVTFFVLVCGFGLDPSF